MIKKTEFLIIFAIILMFLTGISTAANEKETKMRLTSPDFENNSNIPKKFTCQGQDINPSLVITDIPDKAKTFALVFYDPDATTGTWVHWLVFDIPVINRIDENSAPGIQGVTSNGETGYNGPCPPSGTHRYFFKIYALDTSLNPRETIDKNKLETAMRGHILDKAELIGLYKKI